MSSSPRLLALSLMFGLGLSALAPGASAAPPDNGKEEGRTRFQRGIELYKEGNFHAALAEFRAANEAAPSVRIQYNLGQTLFQLQDYAGALAAFETYLGEGRDKIPEDRLKEVEADIAKLRQRVATLKITVSNVEAASASSVSITVDDEARALAQGSLRVSAGRRKIAVTASGYQTETRILDVAGSAVVEVRFELKPIFQRGNEGARGNVAPPPPPQRTPKSRAPFYVGLGATAALGAGAITFAVLASNKHSAWDAAQNQPNPSKGELDDLRSSTKTLSLVADIFTGATIAAGATSLVLLFVTSGDEEPTPKTANARMRPVVRPVVGPQSLGLGGTF